MALTADQQATLKRLRAKLDRDLRDRRINGIRVPGFLSLQAYYRGRQRLAQLGIAVPEELREFVTIVDWPGTYVDAIVTRLRPQGFLLDDEMDDDLWQVWQSNNMDSEIRMGLTDMLVYGRGYLSAGSRDDAVATASEVATDVPLLTVESPLQMAHEWSNRRRCVTAAARFYSDMDNGRKVRRATLYEPDATTWLVAGKNGWELDGEPDKHEVGRVMVHPLINRSSTEDRYGESEMHTIIGLTDAAARALTNAQIATEVVALPQKYAAGMTLADFKDEKTGEALTAWETYIGSVWATTNEKAKFGQFTAADLSNFKTIIGVYAQLTAGVTGLPMRYLGQLSDNPPSADGIRADEARLVGTAEEKQICADDPIENTMRDAMRIKTGSYDPDLLELQTRWRSAATPTQAQAADAATKLVAEKIISRRQARKDLGYTPKEISKMEEEISAEMLDPFLASLMKDDGGITAGAGA